MKLPSNLWRSLAGRLLPWPGWVTYDPALVPPPALMRREGIVVLEDWFRWAEEWSMLLRVYCGLSRSSSLLEIGCGLGRIAFPLRYLVPEGSYDGFEICKEKVNFLNRKFHPAFPNFRFQWANIYNSYYNPKGTMRAADYRFPAADASLDVVFAASVFTHLTPESAAHYFRESARVLKPGGRCLFSFFLLDNYRRGRPRPRGFSVPAFNFDHAYGDHGDGFATVVPENPEQMTAYRLRLVRELADSAGLELDREPLPGLWSGTSGPFIAAQDLVVLRSRADGRGERGERS